LSLKVIDRIMGIKESEWKLPALDHRFLILESLENEFMVAGTDSHTQQVAQVPKHGHEGKLPIVDELLPDGSPVPPQAQLPLPGLWPRKLHPLPSSARIPWPREVTLRKEL
jgi:hypothetical protein